MAERIYADQAEEGDLILWCGRVAEVVEIRTPPIASTGRRTGRHLMLDAFGDHDLRRCQYYDDEIIERHARTLRRHPLAPTPHSGRHSALSSEADRG